MLDLIQPIIHKAPVMGLAMAINKTGLSIGDKADLRLLADGRIGIFALVRHRLFFVPRLSLRQIGHLGPQATALIGPVVERGDYLRVRIVGITPEHLAADGKPEVFLSIWGHLHYVPQSANRQSEGSISEVSLSSTGLSDPQPDLTIDPSAALPA